MTQPLPRRSSRPLPARSMGGEPGGPGGPATRRWGRWLAGGGAALACCGCIIPIGALVGIGMIGALVSPSSSSTPVAVASAPAVQEAAASTEPATTPSTTAPASSAPAPSTTPAPAPTTTPAPSPAPTTAPPVIVYASCDEAVAAGAAPLQQGDPGFSAALDRDGDGVACEVEPAPAPAPAPTVEAAAPAPDPAPVRRSAPEPDPVTAVAPLVDSGSGEGSGSSGSVYYKNCDAARAAGAAPILVGDPGYRGALDRDGDGVACES